MSTFLRIERPTSATLRPSSCGGVDHLLHAVDVRREARHDDAALAAREDLLQVRSDDRLRRREAVAVDVRRVAAQQQHALAAELRQARDVGRLPVDGGLVELVVAGDQHRPELASRSRPRWSRESNASCGSSPATNGPSSNASPVQTSSSSTSRSLCSSSFERAIAIVSGPPYTGGPLPRRARAAPTATPRDGPRGRA